ncbi:hypothetical protein [Sporosarcina sp. FSL K6-5500]|uniref:hypothetical protein n=1 Tax=Sporosarcina sp. FSL K6-5500 TaxID=2921558 RepID=UPI0030F5D32F
MDVDTTSSDNAGAALAEGNVTISATASLAGSTTSTPVTLEVIKDITSPEVATKLPVAGTNAVTAALVFSEAIDLTSRNAVKTAVETAYTVVGNAVVVIEWAADNKTLNVTVTNNTGSVTSTVIASIGIKDLAGHTAPAIVQ